MKKFQLEIPFLLQRLSLGLFAIFPIALSIIAQTHLIIRSWSLVKLFLFGFLVALFLIPVFVLFANKSIWITIEKYEIISIIWVVGLAIVLRIVFVQMISTDFVSDMEDVHLFAVDIYSGSPLVNIEKYPNIPDATYLTITGIFLSFIYKVFGASPAIAKLLLIALAGLTTWLIYLVGREMANNQVGFVVAFLYATLPSLICYSGVLTGDYFALPLMLLVNLIHIRLIRLDAMKNLYYIVGLAVCGVLIGCVDWFRIVGSLLLISIVISTLIYQIGKRRISSLLLGLCALIFTYFTISNQAVRIVESFLDLEIENISVSQNIGGELLVGLNPETNGVVTPEDKKVIRETYSQYGTNYSAANKYLTSLALERFKQANVTHFLIEKFDLIWSSHNALFDYSLAGSNDRELIELMRAFETILFLVITILIFIHGIFSLYGKSDPVAYTMQLFILGFALLLLVFEVQNRYVVIIIPYSIMLSVLGMKNTLTLKFKSMRT